MCNVKTVANQVSDETLRVELRNEKCTGSVERAMKIRDEVRLEAQFGKFDTYVCVCVYACSFYHECTYFRSFFLSFFSPSRFF